MKQDKISGGVTDLKRMRVEGAGASVVREEPAPNFSEGLFWDVDAAQIDWDRNRPYVIERVLNRGTLKDLRTLFGY